MPGTCATKGGECAIASMYKVTFEGSTCLPPAHYTKKQFVVQRVRGCLDGC